MDPQDPRHIAKLYEATEKLGTVISDNLAANVLEGKPVNDREETWIKLAEDHPLFASQINTLYEIFKNSEEVVRGSKDPYIRDLSRILFTNQEDARVQLTLAEILIARSSFAGELQEFRSIHQEIVSELDILQEEIEKPITWEDLLDALLTGKLKLERQLG